MITDRERLIATVAKLGTTMAPDAVVVLCGEDAVPRLGFAMGKMHKLAQHAQANGWANYQPPLILTGGVHNPPRWRGALECERLAVTAGLHHERIITDTESMNTRDQAVNVVKLAMDKGWRGLMIVASAYHLPRAFLTFLKALQDAGIDKACELNMVPDLNESWFDVPEGMGTTRADLLDDELDKCELYTDDVATFAEGIEYLKYWETRKDGRDVS